ncbi:MAG: bifunctional (p)ppGpp synthetase/guanosine-3',5'-bis(diphosphate) 3'-pyrophosphohydrolase, partial [Chlorobi bacterium]|nr:bifunctional (p)ppGpp synthetase/guanosine-3',5'-bis(diphosphate) 3'-pyrophosphohydrolase [Chlorobiota bacterium]
YELKNGDTVKILTNKNKKPNAEWLKIAKSSRTKNKIKRALKGIRFNKAEQGKELVKDKLERLKLKFSEKNIEILTSYFNYKTAVEFYHNVGEGNIDISKIKQAFEKKEEKLDNKKFKEDLISEIISDNEDISKDYLLIGNNISNLDYSLATCCNPLPGDKIFGFISVNKGTRIHKKSCKNAKDMISRFPYRVVDAKWNTENINTTFSANIFVSGKDTPGIATKITEIITKEFNLTLQAISLKMLNDNNFEGIITVKINNKNQLNDLNKRLKALKNIKQIYLK